MKTTNQTETNKPNPTIAGRLAGVCVGTCQKLVAQIQKTKNTIFTEFRATRAAHEQLLRLALNEAEALAWQTEFPQLVFPTLALEKAEAVAAWEARQRSLRRTEAVLPL